MSEEKKVRGLLTIENTRIIFKNFAGKKTEYNEEGNRNFGVLLSDEDAERLGADGWNVKYLRPREDDPDDYRQPWIQVKVRFDNYPPNIYIVKKSDDNSLRKIKLDENTVGQLDWANVESVDIQISPYNYPARSGRPAGVSAYLKTLYVMIKEDDLEAKYGSIPEAEDFQDIEIDDEELPFN